MPPNLYVYFLHSRTTAINNKAVQPIPVHESVAKSSEGSATGNLETVKEAYEISPELEESLEGRI